MKWRSTMWRASLSSASTNRLLGLVQWGLPGGRDAEAGIWGLDEHVHGAVTRCKQPQRVRTWGRTGALP